MKNQLNAYCKIKKPANYLAGNNVLFMQLLCFLHLDQLVHRR